MLVCHGEERAAAVDERGQRVAVRDHSHVWRRASCGRRGSGWSTTATWAQSDEDNDDDDDDKQQD